jgi:hypothetical protein
MVSESFDAGQSKVPRSRHTGSPLAGRGPVFQVEFDSTPTPDNQQSLPSRIEVVRVGPWVGRLSRVV